jgi:hypothetical protein
MANGRKSLYFTSVAILSELETRNFLQISAAAREKLIESATLLADALSVTLGPTSERTLIQK